MKKINNKGFILAETLIVAVFLMVIFAMLYANFYPLIGEYEKRENYDDVDGKYTAYWIKRMIESNDYQLTTENIRMLNRLGYTRFECSNMNGEEKKSLCRNLLKSLEISRCDSMGNGCDIYLTRFQIDDSNVGGGTIYPPSLKAAVRGEQDGQNGAEITGVNEFSVQQGRSPYAATDVATLSASMDACCKKSDSSLNCSITSLDQTQPSFNNYSALYSGGSDPAKSLIIAEGCHDALSRDAFLSATKDYILTLPKFQIQHEQTGAFYRVIVVVHHLKDGNSFYSFSTMEVVR